MYWDRFFQEGVLGKELFNKQKAIENLLNIVNSMHTNTKYECSACPYQSNQYLKNVSKHKVKITYQSKMIHIKIGWQ